MPTFNSLKGYQTPSILFDKEEKVCGNSRMGILFRFFSVSTVQVSMAKIS